MSRRTIVQSRTKRTPAPAPTPPAPPPTPAEPVELTDDAMPTADALSAMLAELADGGDGSTVSVYRELKGEKPGYLFRTTPEGFSLDALRDEYGGGEFRLYITRAGTLYRNVSIKVEAPRRAPAQASQSVDIAAALREGLQAQADALAKAAPARAPFSIEHLPAILTAGAGVITALRALLPAPAPGPAHDPAREESRAVSMLLKGIEMGKQLAGVKGSDDDGSGLLGVVRDLAPAFAQAIANAPRPAPPQRPTPTAAPPAIAGPAAAAPAPEPAPADPIATFIALLCETADEDMREDPEDPEQWRVGLYGALILDKAPDAMLRAMLAQADPVAELAQTYPQISERRAWFLELVETLRHELATQDADDTRADDAPAPHGHNGTAVIQAAPSPRGAARGADDVAHANAPLDSAPAGTGRNPRR